MSISPRNRADEGYQTFSAGLPGSCLQLSPFAPSGHSSGHIVGVRRRVRISRRAVEQRACREPEPQLNDRGSSSPSAPRRGPAQVHHLKYASIYSTGFRSLTLVSHAGPLHIDMHKIRLYGKFGTTANLGTPCRRTALPNAPLVMEFPDRRGDMFRRDACGAYVHVKVWLFTPLRRRASRRRATCFIET